MGKLVAQRWSGNAAALRARDRRAGDFEAYVPHRVFDWQPSLSADIAAFIAQSEQAVQPTKRAPRGVPAPRSPQTPPHGETPQNPVRDNWTHKRVPVTGIGAPRRVLFRRAPTRCPV